MATETAYNEYTSGNNFETFNQQIDVESGAAEFDIPALVLRLYSA